MYDVPGYSEVHSRSSMRRNIPHEEEIIYSSAGLQ